MTGGLQNGDLTIIAARPSFNSSKGHSLNDHLLKQVDFDINVVD